MKNRTYTNQITIPSPSSINQILVILTRHFMRPHSWKYGVYIKYKHASQHTACFRTFFSKCIAFPRWMNNLNSTKIKNVVFHWMPITYSSGFFRIPREHQDGKTIIQNKTVLHDLKRNRFYRTYSTVRLVGVTFSTVSTSVASAIAKILDDASARHLNG